MNKSVAVVPTYNPTQLNYDYISELRNLHALGFDIYIINNNSNILFKICRDMYL